MSGRSYNIFKPYNKAVLRFKMNQVAVFSSICELRFNLVS